MGHRNLDGFHIQLFREIDGTADAFARLARQSQNEVAMDGESELVAIFRELARALNCSALLDVLENLLIPGLVADNQQTAAGVPHSFQRLVIRGDPRRA